MKRTGHEEQFSYDETLLHEGRYREWFWQGLEDHQIAFLNAPVKVPAPPAPEPIYKNQEFPQVKRWRDNAACAGADPVVFFGGSGADLKAYYSNPKAEWRKLCPQCPVRQLCLELARKSGAVGIFGGKYFAFAHASNYTGQVEYDDETLPKKGRPRKTVKSPMRINTSERDRMWQEMQKEINDRISNSGTH